MNQTLFLVFKYGVWKMCSFIFRFLHERYLRIMLTEHNPLHYEYRNKSLQNGQLPIFGPILPSIKIFIFQASFSSTFHLFCLFELRTKQPMRFIRIWIYSEFSTFCGLINFFNYAENMRISDLIKQSTVWKNCCWADCK